MWRKKNQKTDDKKIVKFIPLTQNQEKAKILLFHTLECYPFNYLGLKENLLSR